MPKITIKSLEAQVATLRELREGEARTIDRLKIDLTLVKAENEELKKDKAWLRQMHSSMLQATAEMFRNR